MYIAYCIKVQWTILVTDSVKDIQGNHLHHYYMAPSNVNNYLAILALQEKSGKPPLMAKDGKALDGL